MVIKTGDVLYFTLWHKIIEVVVASVFSNAETGEQIITFYQPPELQHNIADVKFLVMYLNDQLYICDDTLGKGLIPIYSSKQECMFDSSCTNYATEARILLNRAEKAKDKQSLARICALLHDCGYEVTGVYKEDKDE